MDTSKLACCISLLNVKRCTHGMHAGGGVTKEGFSGNLQGDVLILSINRVPYSDVFLKGFPQPLSDLVKSAQDCEDQCSVVSGCQGWTYCSAAEGCGAGCRAYHEEVGPSKWCRRQ
jgi:hypothetical protein